MSYDEEVGKLWEEIRDRIAYRINSNRKAFLKLGLKSFYVAGGALLPAEPNDYDLFPVNKKDFDCFFRYERGEQQSKLDVKIWETSNAVTYEINGIKIQLCKFWNESIIKTVERFDFTHCKLGAKFEVSYANKEVPVFIPVDVYVSEDFIRYRILGYSEYTGVQLCDYPLSSLLRMYKYIKRGYVRSTYDVIFKILEAFLERGYKDEEDFKQQLEGIDIGVDEAQQLDANSKSLKHLYYLVTGNTIKDDSLFEKAIMIGEELK